MNKQIIKLAEQAGYTPLPGFDFANELQEVFLEKFAKLVVKECIKVVDDTMTENQEMNIGLVMASAAIVSHFEIEE